MSLFDFVEAMENLKLKKKLNTFFLRYSKKLKREIIFIHTSIFCQEMLKNFKFS
jgi:hypothetical protein